MGILSQLTRRKHAKKTVEEKSELAKVLTAFDLTALGVGCTLGVGIFVLPGVVAKEIAGPAGIVSFFIAAVTSVFAGLCFAEFGARVPKAGSAYIYSYVTVGEFIAFIIGWTVIIEYVIGSASVARGLSVYIDAMVDKQMEFFYRELFQIDLPYISEYFDIFAFSVSIIITIGLAVGLKESMTLNNILTSINVSVVIFVIVLGSFKADINNWKLDDVPEWAGSGGFFPYGVLGAVKASATCFFGYVGFDCISATGEEVKNPQKSIPLAIILSLAIVFMAYFGVASVVTLMWPYYLQDEEAPIPIVFERVGWTWAKWIVAVGGVFGLLASLVAGLFPLPRIIYAMAQDGLLFKFLGKVHKKYRTPFVGTLVAGTVTGLMASMFNLRQLVDLMSIATLLAYTIVAACVLILRYRPEEVEAPQVSHEFVEHTHLISKQVRVTMISIFVQMANYKLVDSPSKITSAVVVTQTIFFCILSMLLGIVTVDFESSLINGELAPIIVCSLIIALMILSLISIGLQPSSQEKLAFKVPFVPVLPALSILVNIYLMMLMDSSTWIRFLIWLSFGLVIYFSYGVFNSVERRKSQPIEYNIVSEQEQSEYEEIKS